MPKAGMSPPTPSHLVIDRSTARPGPYRGAPAELFRWLSLLWLKLFGWRLEGDWPGPRKAVILAAPHTSNWDGLHMLAAAGAYRMPLKWMGKKGLTTGPFGRIVLALGCVPVDRGGGADLVSQTTAAFAATPQIILAVAPEGTRSRNPVWKRGYYHIAFGAGVPIILSVLDYGSRTIRLSGMIIPGGDYDADFALIRTHYETASGRRPGQFALPDAEVAAPPDPSKPGPG